jgi:hypothetical protein
VLSTVHLKIVPLSLFGLQHFVAKRSIRSSTIPVVVVSGAGTVVFIFVRRVRSTFPVGKAAPCYLALRLALQIFQMSGVSRDTNRP